MGEKVVEINFIKEGMSEVDIESIKAESNITYFDVSLSDLDFKLRLLNEK